MRLRDIHPDVERYFAEDCYCPNEVYSVDGFCYQLVFADAECTVLGSYQNMRNSDEIITFVATASGKNHDHPILLNIWHTDTKVTYMERYEYSDDNVKNIAAFLRGEAKSVTLTESDALMKSVAEILQHADAIMVS